MSQTHSVHSIQDTSLGLTAAELQLLRQQQQVMAQRSHQDSRAAERGRGTSRHSQPSSRGASAASSQAGQRILLDQQSLRALQVHLDSVLRAIENRISEVCFTCNLSRIKDTDYVNSLKMRRKRRLTQAAPDTEIQRLLQTERSSVCGISLHVSISLKKTSRRSPVSKKL